MSTDGLTCRMSQRPVSGNIAGSIYCSDNNIDVGIFWHYMNS